MLPKKVNDKKKFQISLVPIYVGCRSFVNVVFIVKSTENKIPES